MIIIIIVENNVGIYLLKFCRYIFEIEIVSETIYNTRLKYYIESEQGYKCTLF